MDEETEGTSYLADLNKAPDFIDEAPIEVAEVSCTNSFLPARAELCRNFTAAREGSRKDDRMKIQLFLLTIRNVCLVHLNYEQLNIYPLMYCTFAQGLLYDFLPRDTSMTTIGTVTSYQIQARRSGRLKLSLPQTSPCTDISL